MVSNVLKYLLAALLIIFGVNKFAGFLPPPEISGDGAELMRIYFTSGFFKIIGVLEIISGVLILANKYVPLAFTIAAAILFNALVFHLLHDPAGSPGAIVGLLLTLASIFTRKEGMDVLKS